MPKLESSCARSYATLEQWIEREGMRFSVDASAAFDGAVDRIAASLGDGVELLGLGEPLHGAEDILMLRNRIFRRLVEAHGYSTIAIESSFPRARIVNDYVAGEGGGGGTSYDAVRETGFSHGFGRFEANRELVEWMRSHNADPSRPVMVRFDGFDSPTEMTGSDSPRHLLHFVLDYLASVDGTGQERRDRVDGLLGRDADWENPAAMFEPAKSVGLSPAATALRIEAEELALELCVRRPELMKRDAARYAEAAHYASMARQFLDYHAAVARPSEDRVAALLGIRDAMMAENLRYIVARERGRRGKVLAFAHNTHLQRGNARWQLGANALAWWPAGAHLDAMLGAGYGVIGLGVGVSERHGIEAPESGTLEAQLTAGAGQARFIPTHQGQGLPMAAVAALPTRSASAKNSTYFALGPQSITDFDGLLVLD